LQSLTLTPYPASARQSASLRRRQAWMTQPRSLYCARSSAAIRRVGSIAANSSASSVTVVPASRAAAQILAMFSRAILVPRNNPTAVGFTETSAAPR
jgi:hypothetical protein